jgi:hypothetical protein
VFALPRKALRTFIAAGRGRRKAAAGKACFEPEWVEDAAIKGPRRRSGLKNPTTIRPRRRRSSPLPIAGLTVIWSLSMNTFHPALRLVLLAALPVLLAACANQSAGGPDSRMQYSSDSAGQQGNDASGASKPNLTIQSGEGEKLNVPWFVRDLTDAVNRDGNSAGSGSQ